MNVVFFFLKSFFSSPTFQAGERVNAIRHGHIAASDGYVLAQTHEGVLVEWPTGGTRFEAASELSSIGR